MNLIASEPVEDVPEAAFGALVVCRVEACPAEVVGGADPEGKIVECMRDGGGDLGRRSRLRHVARHQEIVGHVHRDPSPPALVLERGGHRLGLAEIPEDTVERSQGHERRSKLEAHIDRLGQRLTALR